MTFTCRNTIVANWAGSFNFHYSTSLFLKILANPFPIRAHNNIKIAIAENSIVDTIQNSDINEIAMIVP